MTNSRRLRVVGPGRAGSALADALAGSGWQNLDARGRGDDLASAARGADLVVVAVPDGAIAEVAAAIETDPDVVVCHLAGSLGLEVLAGHERRAAVHPLMALPDRVTGAERLLGGGWFAVAGDEVARQVVDDLGGHSFEVADDQRTLYHATAVVASNHLVALLAQVERLAAASGVPLEAFWPLVRGTVDNVQSLGARSALTGPAARGDEVTIARHLDALAAAVGDDDVALYEALVAAARRVVA